MKVFEHSSRYGKRKSGPGDEFLIFCCIVVKTSIYVKGSLYDGLSVFGEKSRDIFSVWFLLFKNYEVKETAA